MVRDFQVDYKMSPIQLRLYHRGKGYMIPEDEPLYVLRGADPVAVEMVKFYIDSLRDEEQSEIVVDHERTSHFNVKRFEDFKANNPDRMGKMYPEEGCSCIVPVPSLDIGTENDPMQDPEYTFWDLSLIHI